MKLAAFIRYAGVLCVVATLCAQPNEGPLVRKTFEAYQAAIQDRDGTIARSLVTAATLDSYENLRDLALHSAEAELKERPIFEQLIVLSFRLRFTLPELQITPGAELFSRGVDQGWTSAASAGESALEKLIIIDDRAEASLVQRPSGVGTSIHFARESGTWKVDLVSLSAAVEDSLQAYLTSGSTTEQQLIEETLAAAIGKPLPADIWEPMVRYPSR